MRIATFETHQSLKVSLRFSKVLSNLPHIWFSSLAGGRHVQAKIQHQT